MKYNIEDFDIKIIEINEIKVEYTSNPYLEAKVSVNGYEIRVSYRITREHLEEFRFRFHNLDLEKYLIEQIKNEAFRFYTNNDLLMRKEKIKKIKNKKYGKFYKSI